MLRRRDEKWLKSLAVRYRGRFGVAADWYCRVKPASKRDVTQAPPACLNKAVTRAALQGADTDRSHRDREARCRNGSKGPY
jgi:hypothetical protein